MYKYWRLNKDWTECLPVYGHTYMETIKRTFDDQIYTFFCGLDMAEDGTAC